MSTEKAKVLNIEEARAAREQGDAIAASAKNVVSENTFVFFAALDDEWAVDLNAVSTTDNCFDAYNTYQNQSGPTTRNPLASITHAGLLSGAADHGIVSRVAA